MKNVKILGIVTFDNPNHLKLIGLASLIHSLFFSSSYFNDGTYKLVTLGDCANDSCYIEDEEDNRSYYVTYNCYDGLENEKGEQLYMLTSYDDEKISEEKVTKIFQKHIQYAK